MKLGHEMCSVVQKAHFLTGCDITSNSGTKKVDSVEHLWGFGETNELGNKKTEKTEQYLAKVLPY